MDDQALPAGVRLSYSLFEALHAQRRLGFHLDANEAWLYELVIVHLGEYVRLRGADPRYPQ